MSIKKSKATPTDRPGPLLVYQQGATLVAKRSRPNVAEDSPTDPGNVLRSIKHGIRPPKVRAATAAYSNIVEDE